MSPSFVNVLVSWSANASSFCSVVVCFVTLLCSSVVVSVGYMKLFLGLMALRSFRQASFLPFGKFRIVAVVRPVVLSCLSSVLFDSSVQSVVVGIVVLLSCLLPVTSLSAFFFDQVPNCLW